MKICVIIFRQNIEKVGADFVFEENRDILVIENILFRSVQGGLRCERWFPKVFVLKTEKIY